MRFTPLITAALATSLGLTACDVEQTEEGELPEVDVDVEEGNMPEYNVDAPEITAGTTEKEVEVPEVDVDVTTEEKTVDVPVIAFEPGDVDEEKE